MKQRLYPKVKSVKPNYTLIVTFDNHVVKKYDCTPILKNPLFKILQDPAFFKNVHVDTGGYGISWNDDLDLSEYELWTNGVELM